MPLRLAALFVTMLLFSSMLPSAAQDSSIQVLETPERDATSQEEVVLGEPSRCGRQPIAIARMRWPSGALLAGIHAELLDAHFGCEVRVQEGDLAATGSSMGATGQPAVAPEMWIARIADIWNAAIKAQKVRQAGPSYVEAVYEGWFVPDYAVAAWPEIASIEGLKQHVAALWDSGERWRFISCPADWGCNLINRNMLRAHGLDAMLEVVEPASRFELDALIAEAVSRKEPILFYYWQPNAILAQFEFTPVGLGPYDGDAFQCLGREVCSSPTPTGFAPDPVVIALAEWVFTEAPEVASYFQRAKMPLAEMNAMLAQLSQTGATVQGIVDRFIAERGAVWRPWVGMADAEELSQ